MKCANHQIPEASAYEASFFYPSPESVIGRVLGAMLRGERLTGKDCWLRFGSSRLAGHICQLGKEGWPVERIDIGVTTSDAHRRATIAEYWLSPKAIQAAGGLGQQFAQRAKLAELRRRAG